MRSALVHLFWLSSLSGALVAAGWVMTSRLANTSKRQPVHRWLTIWAVKGLVVPFIIWSLLNIGISWNLQPFMPQIQAAQNSGGSWAPAYFRVMADGLFIICSYWAALTLGWALFLAATRLEGEHAAAFKSLAWACGLGMVVPAIICVLVGGLPLLGLGVAFIVVPLAGYAPDAVFPTRTPIYARAVARMKFGKYSEAELEIIQELEKCEDDFEGWMMLAELYANHFNDLAEAEQTVLEVCDQPRTTPSQLSVALHRLADWHLKVGGDPDAARRALQMICDRLPGTHLAKMAQLRTRRLPQTASEWQEQKSGSAIPLPALGDALDEEFEMPHSAQARTAAARAANACVEKLQANPDNSDAREKLARLMAEQLDRVEQALEQVSLLLDMPNQPHAKRAEWLSLAAAWHIKYRHDWDAGRNLLEQLLRDFPDTPQAFAASRRLAGLKLQNRE